MDKGRMIIRKTLRICRKEGRILEAVSFLSPVCAIILLNILTNNTIIEIKAICNLKLRKSTMKLVENERRIN